ncbi:MAG: hypothetical protein ACRD2Z_06555 [Thermoanaerobaculia bacterium]
MRRLLALCTLLLLAAPASSDTVYLTNGNSFEGVVATDLGDSVRIVIESGAITLPASQVRRIERGTTALAEYRQRRDGLDATDPNAAPDWLALARWARGQGLTASARAAALAAALLDPDLEGVAALLREQGYVQDPDTGVWIEYAAYQRSRGMAHDGDAWVPLVEQEARWREREQRAAAQRQEERLDRLSRVVELATLAQIAAAQRPPEPQPVYTYPVAVFPGFVFERHDHGKPGPSFELRPVDFSALSGRLPGSRIPIQSDPKH